MMSRLGMAGGRVDEYQVNESTGRRDSAAMLEGLNTRTGRTCALKLLLRSGQSNALFQLQLSKLRVEFERQSQLSEEYVWPARSFSSSSTYVDSLGETIPAAYVELDSCKQGSFFTIQAAVNKPMNETLARTYFHQLISALIYCNSTHVVHWNVMSENLLMNDRDMTIRLAGFRTAETVDRRKQMSAPELSTGTESNGAAVDVFACGFALFSWLYLEAPFEKAEPTNLRYKQFLEGNEKFWQRNRLKKVTISENLKELLSSMLALDPAQRPTLAEIKAHSWYTGAVYSSEMLITKMQGKLRKSLERRTLKFSSSNSRVALKGKAGVYRSEGQSSDTSLSSSGGGQAPLLLYVPTQSSFSQLFLFLSPDLAWDCALRTLSEDLYIKCFQELEAYKVQVRTTTETAELTFTMQLLDCSEGRLCLDFNLDEGSSFDFLYTFQSFVVAAEKWLD